jgi:tetratricopeptide (TPR) repeat protein
VPQVQPKGSLNNRGGSSGDRLLPLAFMVFAVALRLFYLRDYTQGSPFYWAPQADARIYQDWARSIAAGDWLSRSEGVFYRAPLYPYLLALLLRCFGAIQPAVQVLQFLMGLGSLTLVGLLARRMAGGTVALVAMGLLILYGPFLAAESKMLPTTLGIFLHLVSIWCVLRVSDRPGWAGGVLAGACLGLSSLVRPQWVLLGLVFPLLLRRRGDPVAVMVRRWVPFWLTLLLVLAPVTVRNRALGGAWVLISSNGGMTFYQGNNEANNTGFLTLPPRFELFGSASLQRSWETRLAEETEGRPLGAAGVNAYWTKSALRFMAGHPYEWFALEGRKLLRCVSSFEWSDDVSFYLERARAWPLRVALVPFGVILALALLGSGRPGGEGRLDPDAVRTWRLLVASAATGLAGCLVFYVNSRYRMESVPALAALGGVAVARAGFVIRATRERRAAGLLTIFLASTTLVVSFLPPGRVAVAQESAGQFQIGQAWEHLGRVPQALDAYARAREILPGNVFAWNAETLLLARSGHITGADSLLSRAPRDPVQEHPLSLYTRGLLRMEQGDLDRAITDLEGAVRGNAFLIEAHSDLARALEKRRDYARAAQELEAARALSPQKPEFPARLAYLRLQLREYAAAREACLEFLRLRPKDPAGMFNLAVASFYLGDLDEAERNLAGAVESGSEDDLLAFYYRGLLALRRGDAMRAAEDLGRICSEEPRNRRALYYRSLALSREGSLSMVWPGWQAAWEGAFGDEIRPVLPALEEWIHRRSEQDWGSPLDQESKVLMSRLERTAGATALALDLKQTVEDECGPMRPGSGSLVRPPR